MLSSLVGPIVIVAVALLAGWLLLETIKWLVVLLMYVLGAALIIVPIFAGSRVLADAPGSERFRRILTLVGVVASGVLLIAAASVVRHHGWVLVAVPLGIIAVDRLRRRIQR